MRKCLFLFFFFLFPVLAVFAQQSGSYSLVKDLKQGDFGYDVALLQQFLNKSPDTQVAVSGAGSPGNETDYFGPATKNAVIRFQNKYASEVLNPIGLFSGTGYVGTLTRQKINSLLVTSGSVGLTSGSAQTSPIPSSSGFEFASFFPESSKPFIAFPSAYSGLAGSLVTLSGGGFSGNNTIYFGNKKISNVQAVSSASLVFTVPSDVSFGSHDVYVSNSGGKSNETFFVVKNPNVSTPVITSVLPYVVRAGEKITVSGSGFSSKNNIRLGYETVENVSATNSGTSLSFSIPVFEAQGNVPSKYEDNDRSEPATSLPEVLLPMMLYVQNDGGISNGIEFKLKYDY